MSVLSRSPRSGAGSSGMARDDLRRRPVISSWSIGPSPTRHSPTTVPGRDDSSTTRSASLMASRTSCVTNRIQWCPWPATRAIARPQPRHGDRVEHRERLVHQEHQENALGLAARGSECPGRDTRCRTWPDSSCGRLSPWPSGGERQQLLRALTAVQAALGPRAAAAARRCAAREPRQQRRLLEHERRTGRAQLQFARGRRVQLRDQVGSVDSAARAPSRRTNSPGSTCRSMLRSAATASAPCPKVLATPRSVSAGVRSLHRRDRHGHLVTLVESASACPRRQHSAVTATNPATLGDAGGGSLAKLGVAAAGRIPKLGEGDGRITGAVTA